MNMYFGVIRAIFGLFWLTIWMAGIVLAKGFWSTFFAVITSGLWSFYLVVERVLQATGWI